MDEKELKREMWGAIGNIVGLLTSLALSIYLGIEVARVTGKTVWGFVAFFAFDALFSIDRQTRVVARHIEMSKGINDQR